MVLTHRELLGFDFECHIYDYLRASGLSSYLTFMNPLSDKAAWKRERGHGADFKLQLPNGDEYIVEAKFRISDVEERLIWYKQDVASRFQSDNPNIHRLLVTNKPEAFKAAAKKFTLLSCLNVSIVTISELLSLLTTATNKLLRTISNATSLINNYDNRVWVNGLVTFELKLSIDKLISQLSVSLIGNVNE